VLVWNRNFSGLYAQQAHAGMSRHDSKSIAERSLQFHSQACRDSLTCVKTLRRPPQPSDLVIVEIGGKKVLANPSGSTATSIAMDYGSVRHQLLQISIIAEQKRSGGFPYEPFEIRRDFAGRRVLDFAEDKDLVAAASKNRQKTSSLAAEMIARTTGLSPRTVLQYAKHPRVSDKNQQKVIRPTRRK
jgi:hypothetical protein